MKKIILLLSVLASFAANAADSLKFKSLDLTEIRNTIDTIVVLSNKPYSLKRIDSSFALPGSVNTKFTYIYQTGDGREMKIFIDRYVWGENKDLERPGTIYYNLVSIMGKYLDIFPTWKRIDANADQEATSKSGRGKYVKYVYQGQEAKPQFLSMGDGVWWLRVNTDY